MPQYLAPGVYVEEVPVSPPIAGVGTSTAGFIGAVTVKPPADGEPAPPPLMPYKPGRPEDPDNPKPEDRYELVGENDAQRITSWDQFKTKFGDFHQANLTLAHAVYGFFNNGGTACYVTRVNDAGDATAVGEALKQFEAIDEIAIVAVPGALAQTVQLAVIEHCERMRDRFAILDGQETTTITPSAIQGPLRDSEYAALYYPRLNVFDPVSGKQLAVHPSGHMAGIYARVDAQRGVHKAPANEIVRGALSLAYLVSRNEQQELNREGINVIRSFNGNILVWGARTLGGDANEAAGKVKYINVRRLLNFMRESIDEGTQFAVFEPNAQPLWQRITRSTTAFLTNIWRDGALFGTTPEQAFYVRCDESTNPPDVRALGQVVTEIGVAIVKPAEFVIFRISQIAGPAS
ncbi:MAG: phage tail sheath subtilisin-like domain-containing protein [Caldilineaceae bacterium]